ncbi:MAG: hypothetical protein ACR2PM_14495 [Hyphomicrobiales bacterium]
MMTYAFKNLILAAGGTVLVLIAGQAAVSPSLAQKAKFERTKPHLNTSAGAHARRNVNVAVGKNVKANSNIGPIAPKPGRRPMTVNPSRGQNLSQPK